MNSAQRRAAARQRAQRALDEASVRGSALRRWSQPPPIATREVMPPVHWRRIVGAVATGTLVGLGTIVIVGAFLVWLV